MQEPFARLLLSRLFCWDFLHKLFACFFLHGFFHGVLGCPKPLAEKRQHFTEKLLRTGGLWGGEQMEEAAILIDSDGPKLLKARSKSCQAKEWEC